MAKNDTKDKKTSKPTGKSYVCICGHSEPVIVDGVYKGFKARKPKDTATFDKNPGPCWRPAKIEKTEEVS